MATWRVNPFCYAGPTHDGNDWWRRAVANCDSIPCWLTRTSPATSSTVAASVCCAPTRTSKVTLRTVKFASPTSTPSCPTERSVSRGTGRVPRTNGLVNLIYVHNVIYESSPFMQHRWGLLGKLFRLIWHNCFVWYDTIVLIWHRLLHRSCQSNH